MTKSENYQLGDDVVFDSLQHFIKLWKNGKDAFLNVNCRGGRAWLSFSTYLGFQDKATQATSVAKDRKAKASPSKIRRNQARAEAHREKRRQEAEASRLHSPSAQSKEINASFSSCINSLIPSVAKAAVNPVPVSTVSMENSESICEKVEPTLKELEPSAEELSNNTRSIAPIEEDIHHNRQGAEQFVDKVKSNLLGPSETTYKPSQAMPSENGLLLPSKVVRVQSPQQQVHSALSESSFSSAALTNPVNSTASPLPPAALRLLNANIEIQESSPSAAEPWQIPTLYSGGTYRTEELRRSSHMFK